MQKTAYEVRISDWSSDVCSTDRDQRVRRQFLGQAYVVDHARERGDQLGRFDAPYRLDRAMDVCRGHGERSKHRRFCGARATWISQGHVDSCQSGVATLQWT